MGIWVRDINEKSGLRGDQGKMEIMCFVLRLEIFQFQLNGCFVGMQVQCYFLKEVGNLDIFLKNFLIFRCQLYMFRCQRLSLVCRLLIIGLVERVIDQKLEDLD